VNHRELTKKLRRLECEFVRHAAGSHEIWWRPSTPASRPSRITGDLAQGTLRAILRDLRIDKKEFKNA
jgi:predicted RNA binding protein YcfA (HicA-like mRNA interferase family)